jgi:hypothetical protein
MEGCDVLIGCAYCGKPLALIGGRTQSWCAPSGLRYCTEFCADDADEAVFQKQRKLVARGEGGPRGA